jgi:hypothetical protein
MGPARLDDMEVSFLSNFIGDRKHINVLSYCVALHQLWGTCNCGKRAVWSPCSMRTGGPAVGRGGLPWEPCTPPKGAPSVDETRGACPPGEQARDHSGGWVAGAKCVDGG